MTATQAVTGGTVL